MSKATLKKAVMKKQHEKCAISKEDLPDDVKLFDADRQIPKTKGGIFEPDNTRAVLPVEHMKYHGNYRTRKEDIEILKQVIDNRQQIIKLRNKINNQLLAFKRGTDVLSTDTIHFLGEELARVDKEESKWTKELSHLIKQIAKHDPLAFSAMEVKSIGPVTVAYCLVYIDLEKAPHPSNLWSYAGLHKPSHERYEKGIAGGGNKSLRTALYTTATSQIKGNGPYRVIYDRVKQRLSVSNKLVKTRNTQGKLVEIPWKETKPSHRHGAALRAIMKHFLADYWMVGRTLMGLPVSPLYAESMLGNGHKTIEPEERGWIY